MKRRRSLNKKQYDYFPLAINRSNKNVSGMSLNEFCAKLIDTKFPKMFQHYALDHRKKLIEFELLILNLTILIFGLLFR